MSNTRRLADLFDRGYEMVDIASDEREIVVRLALEGRGLTVRLGRADAHEILTGERPALLVP